MEAISLAFSLKTAHKHALLFHRYDERQHVPRRLPDLLTGILRPRHTRQKPLVNRLILYSNASRSGSFYRRR